MMYWLASVWYKMLTFLCVLADVNVNDVADEYTVYQKLPTFFYEYTRKKKD